MVPNVPERRHRERRELAVASSKRNGQEADANNRQQKATLSRLALRLAAACSATSCKMLRPHVRRRHRDKQHKNYESHQHTHLFLDGSLLSTGQRTCRTHVVATHVMPMVA